MRFEAHNTCMQSRLLALLSAVLIAGLSVSSVMDCAGWQPSPQARMACCTGAEHECAPQDADDCCAQSQQKQQRFTHAARPLVVEPAVLSTALTYALAAALPDQYSAGHTVTASFLERNALKLPSERTHLLLSVFLI